MKTMLAFVLLAILGIAPVSGDIVRVASAAGDALIARRFNVPANTTIFGVTFTSRDVPGVFPEIALVHGRATNLMTAERLASRGDVRSGIDGVVSCVWVTSVTSGNGEGEYLAVVRLPASSNGKKPGVGVTSRMDRGQSYLACAEDGEFIPVGGEFDMELMTDAAGATPVGKASRGGGAPSTEKPVQATYLGPGAPNPGNATIVIEFGVREAGKVDLSLYDVAGRRVRTLVEDTLIPGVYYRVWDGVDESGRHVGAGIYFMKLRVGVQTMTEKLIVTK